MTDPTLRPYLNVLGVGSPNPNPAILPVGQGAEGAELTSEAPLSTAVLEELVAEQNQAIELIGLDIHKVTELMEKLSAFKRELNAARYERIEQLDQAKVQLRRAKILEAEAALANSLAPNLDDPELQNLIKLLHECPFYTRLDDYQVEDIVFQLDRWNRTKDQPASANNLFIRGIINANDTGMGKTVETLAFLWVMRQVNPTARILWLTKASLVKSTSPEACTKWGFDLLPVIGTTQDRIAMINLYRNLEGTIPMSLIVNYEAMNQPQIREALGTEWDFLIIDEVHKLRGGANYRPTQMWKNMLDFKLQSNAFPIMLSGSIVNNKPREIWAFLHPMDPERWPDVNEFEQLVNSGVYSQRELMRILAPSMFRRTKAEVGIKMPERTIQHHTITLDPKGKLARVYADFATQMMSWLEKMDGEGKSAISFKTVLDQMIRMRAVLVAPGHIKVKRKELDPDTGEVTSEVIETLETGDPEKLMYAAELANELLEEGQQVVICSSGFKAPLDWLHDKGLDPRFKAEKLYGGSAKFGGDIEQRFQRAETQVILTNLQSGAEGFNLHRTADWPGGAEHLIMLDDWYNPELVRQMWDRVWRRGSLNRVIIHVLQVENSIDYVVEAIREGKTAFNSRITESTALRAGDWIKLLKGEAL